MRPPRVAGWKKPWRSLVWGMRRHLEESAFRAEQSDNRLLGGVPRVLRVGGRFVLALVPGLCQALDGRYGVALLIVGIWVLLILVSLFLYGGGIFALSLGLASGLHAWVALDAMGSPRGGMRVRDRVLGIFLLALLFTAGYRWLGGALFSGWQIAEAGLTVPALRVESDHRLLAMRLAARPEGLRRGMLVQAAARGVRVYGGNATTFPVAQMAGFGQIVGVPGDRVVLNGSSFQIGDRVLAETAFPVPAWLRGRKLAVQLGDDEYFVARDYGGSFRNTANLEDRVVLELCVVKERDLGSVAVARWLPLMRRGRLGSVE